MFKMFKPPQIAKCPTRGLTRDQHGVRARKRAHRSCTVMHDHAETRAFLRLPYSHAKRREGQRDELFATAPGPRSQRGGREFEPPAVHQLSLTKFLALPVGPRSAKVA